MMGYNVIGILMIPLLSAVPLLILYLVIKLAVKNAIKEVERERTDRS